MRKGFRKMNERFDDMVFLAVLVSAIILIFAADANPAGVQVLTDLTAAYWVIRVTRDRRPGRGELTR